MLAAVLTATGAQWTVLQSLAWTRMLAANLRTGSFTAAVQKTFDGKHPCGLCKAIAAGKSAEPKQEFTGSLQKFEFPPVTEILVWVAPALFQFVPQENTFADPLAHPPPTPPPRAHLV